jgi:hypothetical protein
MRSKIERYEIMLLTQTKNHSSYPILGNEIGSFYHLYNGKSDGHHQQHYLSESSSSPSLTDRNYLTTGHVKCQECGTLKPIITDNTKLIDSDS